MFFVLLVLLFKLQQTEISYFILHYNDFNALLEFEMSTTFREGPCKQVADLRFKTIHDLTNFSGSHLDIGGPHIEINIKEDICFTLSLDLMLTYISDSSC